MHPSPADEWQRLSRVYLEKSDEELLELSADFRKLTDLAQQALRDELRRRRLPPPSDMPQPSPVAGELPRERTPKMQLCECADQQHAWQICEVLRRAHIESWIEAPAESLDVSGPRVLVAAHQLEAARALTDSPIPQEIVDLSRSGIEDFIPPSCPKCGASDPLLLGVEPSNQWRCDICGAQWNDTSAFDGSVAKPLM